MTIENCTERKRRYEEMLQRLKADKVILRDSIDRHDLEVSLARSIAIERINIGVLNEKENQEVRQ